MYTIILLVFWCMVLWCLHCKGSDGILVDCNTQILLVFWWTAIHKFWWYFGVLQYTNFGGIVVDCNTQILVDCNTQISVVFCCLSYKNFGGSLSSWNVCKFCPFHGLAWTSLSLITVLTVSSFPLLNITFYWSIVLEFMWRIEIIM
jgi:hypothetical protein